MDILKFLAPIIILSFIFVFFNAIGIWIKHYYYVFSETLRKIYRLLNVKKRTEIVWNELIKFHKEEGWNYGQFDKEKYIQTIFNIEDNLRIKFTYQVGRDKLEFQSLILNSFDEDRTTDILVLASHFNGLLNFGKVSVSTKYNCVELIHSGDLVTYMLFPGEIQSDQRVHYNVTRDCCWAFSNLIETGEDPVFVISELLRRKDDDKTNM
ncbi:hypothetical protein [Flavobacterium sp.]|uniref:hypothetical protein n=1 Tax=Flavobacterium sp. TaxID=239 RepID=UPI00248752C8|nr:hypothetical protein [Flavobacterium sp.]MDI1317424.1 hypothetical protein [Flavobacterium sp.]